MVSTQDACLGVAKPGSMEQPSALRILLVNCARVVAIVAAAIALMFAAGRGGCEFRGSGRPQPADPMAGDPPGGAGRGTLQVDRPAARKHMSPALSRISQGLDLLVQDRYDDAEVAFQDALRMDEGSRSTRSLATAFMACVALSRYQYDNARTLYVEARRAGLPDAMSTQWLGHMGWLGASLGFNRDTLGFYEALCARSDCEPRDILWLMWAETAVGRVDEARAHGDQVLSRSKLEPADRVHARLMLASLDLMSPRAASATGRMTEALEDALAGLPPGDPMRVVARQQWVEVLLALGDSAGAESACADLEGDSSYDRAGVAEARGRLAEAEKLAQKANRFLSAPAFEVPGWLLLARIHRLQGRAREAHRDLQRARDLIRLVPQPTPGDRAWVVLAGARLDKDPAAAEKGLLLLAQAGYSGGPRLAQARVIQGDALAAKGRPAQAREAYAMALRLVDESVGRRHWAAGRALVGLGRLAAAEGRQDESRRLLEEGLASLQASLGPEHPEVVAAARELRGR